MIDFKKSYSALLKFLLWSLTGFLICFIGLSKIFALENNGTVYFYDNSGSSLSSVSTNFIQQTGESSAIFTTTSNSYGGAVVLQANTSIVKDHLYTVFINVGAYSNGGLTFLSSKNCIGLGTSFYSVQQSYINCDISPRFSQPSGVTTDKGRGIYYTFVANTNAIYILLPYTTQYTCSNCMQYSFGYNIEDNGDTSGLSQSQVNNMITNQTTIIQNQISQMQNDFNDSIQQQIDSQKVCDTVDKNDVIESGKFLRNNGTIGTSSYYGVTDYVNIHDAEVTVSTVFDDADSSTHLCYYSKNKSFISCENIYNLSSLTIPSNAYYLRTTIFDYRNNNKPILNVCRNGNSAINDSLNDLNDTINDDNVDGATSDAGDFITDFDTDTFGLTSIITAPLNLINSLTTSSCTPLHLPLPYLSNKFLDLPCMSTIYTQYFGAFFTLYQTITFGIVAYWVCVRIFNLVKDFKNPEHDEIEVLDL